MQRITIDELCDLLQCPDCAGPLLQRDDGIICERCKRSYRTSRGKPVLMSKGIPCSTRPTIPTRHQLHFVNECFDAVITTAVLEHVMHPAIVAAKIARVAKTGGFIYSELPFLQNVHEGAYDFTRHTLSGHRALLRAFHELESGATAGPGTALDSASCTYFLGRRRSPETSDSEIIERYRAG